MAAPEHRRLLVTGGRGFLGSRLALAIDSQRWSADFLDFSDFDVTNPIATTEIIASLHPDTICHLAGSTGAEASLADPQRYFAVNVGGTVNVLEAARKSGVREFVYASSLTVHGFSETQPLTEQSEVRPQHPYSASKAAAELIVASYAKTFGMKAVILRPTIVVGRGQGESNAISEFVDAIACGRPIVLYGDGSHRREWLHVDDAVSAIRAAIDHVGTLDRGSPETFIVSSGRSLSLKQLAETVLRVFGSGQIEYAQTNRQAFSLETSTEKAQRVLGWRPLRDERWMVQELLESRQSAGTRN